MKLIRLFETVKVDWIEPETKSKYVVILTVYAPITSFIGETKTPATAVLQDSKHFEFVMN